MVDLNPVQFPDVQSDIHRVSDAYQASRNQPPIRGDFARTVMPAGGTRMVEAQYRGLPTYDNSGQANASYKALEEETGRQFDYMTKPRSKGGLGLDPSVNEHDPYGRTDTSQPFANEPNRIMGDMKNDIAGGKIQALATATTGGTESFRHPDTNDMFRMVHDVFGHGGANRGVDRHGEEAAYQHHRQMFSPEARPALASELRGQTAHLITHGSFIDRPKRAMALDSGPMNPAQFGESMNDLQSQAAGFNRAQGLS